MLLYLIFFQLFISALSTCHYSALYADISFCLSLPPVSVPTGTMLCDRTLNYAHSLRSLASIEQMVKACFTRLSDYLNYNVCVRQIFYTPTNQSLIMRKCIILNSCQVNKMYLPHHNFSPPHFLLSYFIHPFTFLS